MKFLSYSIEGVSSELRNEKLLSEIMIYDYLIWLPDGSNLSIPGFFSFTKERTKHKKAKRHSGVITVLVRKEIRKDVKVFSSSGTNLFGVNWISISLILIRMFMYALLD